MKVDIPNSSITYISVDVADVVLKVNATDKKIVKTIDLWGRVKTDGNSFIYSNNVLEVTLLKEEPVEWP